MKRRLIVSALIGLTFTTPVYAYIDPGTGSFLLQGLIASFLTFMYAIKLYWGKFKKMIFFFRKKKDQSTSENA